MRQLPFAAGSGQAYTNLAVYKGTFVTVDDTGVIAFGLQSNDLIRLGRLSQSSKQYDTSTLLTDMAEYPSNGRARGWTARFAPPYTAYTFYQREVDPINRTDNPVSATDISVSTTHSPYWTCYPQSDSRVSTFFSSTRSYFAVQCWRNDGYSAGVASLIRTDLSGGTWAKTLDKVGLDYHTSALAADPANDGTLFAGSFIPAQTSSLVTKVVVSGSTITNTNLQSINGISGITGLAFGPPTADVVSPKDISDFSPYLAKPWTPIQMQFDSQ